MKMVKQSEMQHIADIGNRMSLSRYENGDRPPNLETALIYYLVLDIPLNKLFPQIYEKLAEQIREKAQSLLESVEQMKEDYTTKNKIDFLNELISRIGCLQEIYDEREK